MRWYQNRYCSVGKFRIFRLGITTVCQMIGSVNHFANGCKDFSVSVAKTYTTDIDGWTRVGSYKAKNVRGVQSFHPLPSLRDFYRYIRIDFEAHYGNEYFCLVSLLKVYGLTHLEQWKWDICETESRVKQEELQKDRSFWLSNGLPVDHIPIQTFTFRFPRIIRTTR